MASLFHSLVVIGAGVSASACGSVTNVLSDGTPDEAPGRNGVGGGANRGSGGAVSTGAQSGIGLFGAVSAGGTAGTGSGNIPLPDPGTIAQWNCTGQLGNCASPFEGMQFTPYKLLDSCPVDPNRPRSSADCANDEWFQCLPARTGDLVVAINCECAPMLDAGCYCNRVGPGSRRIAACHDRDMFCGCAYTGILLH